MKGYNIICVFFAAWSFLCCGNGEDKRQKSEISDGAKLEIADRIDMGEIGEPEFKKFVTIPFKNIGSDTLKIFAVVPECDCTEVELLTPELAPGESGSIRAYLDLKDYPSINVEKPFFIKSNNAGEQYVYVTLVAHRR